MSCRRRPGEEARTPVAVGRYYDPAMGQFLSVDPKVEQTQQTFIYAGDDPVNADDPAGLVGAPACAYNGSCPGAPYGNPVAVLMHAYNIVNNALNNFFGEIGQGASGFLRGNGALQECGSLSIGEQSGCDIGVLLGAVLESGGGEEDLGASEELRAPWELTRQGASAVRRGGPFDSTFLKSASDGTWWTRDLARHGDSVFKVYQETPRGLQWKADANEFGDYLSGKWKGGKGYFIPWSQLGRG